jgi:hypothetical protein
MITITATIVTNIMMVMMIATTNIHHRSDQGKRDEWLKPYKHVINFFQV